MDESLKQYIHDTRGSIAADVCVSKSYCSMYSCNKLNVHDWLKDYPQNPVEFEFVEVRFKNTRKGIYRNVNKLKLKVGDLVAVEASPGHDIGVVSLVGELVREQMRKQGLDTDGEFMKIYRKAKPVDIEKWERAVSLEHQTMLKTRQIVQRLKLEMKISDVEYQGDGTKAIFYYIADDRVDFRELIKILAEQFRIRVEMKQIGARQEAGRVGGIGSCGRELCCTTWITNFVSVTTNAARYQELSLNPQKLAGQCGKLKCCLNYELDSYIDAQKDFPPKNVDLETQSGTAYYQKTDIFKRIMWYSSEKDTAVNLTPVSVDRVKEIIEMNIRDEKPEKLIDEDFDTQTKFGFGENDFVEYENSVGKDSITRFDKPEKKKNKKKQRKSNSNSSSARGQRNKSKTHRNKNNFRRRNNSKK